MAHSHKFFCGHSRPLFLYFRLCNTQLTNVQYIYKFLPIKRPGMAHLKKILTTKKYSLLSFRRNGAEAGELPSR